MKQRLNWDDLKFVLAVARAGSVNAAAQALQVNHATILRRVASFEDAHNIIIFGRETKGYTVTADAVPIIEAIRAVESSIDAMERVIAGKGENLEGSIHVTSTDSLCRTILPPIIRKFHQLHPDLKIELSVTNARLNLAKLDAEVTIRPAKALPSDLVGVKSVEMSFGVYGTPGYIAQNPSTDLGAHCWMGVTDLLGRSPVGTWQSQLPKNAIAFRADSFVTLADMAETGIGLAMIPTCLANHSETLIPAPQFPEKLGTNVWVAAHKDLYDVPRIAVLTRYFDQAIRQSPLA